uniref:Type II inositol-1,4,5-trisphosphate 5-phosphatase FRA3 n=1 Tax=Aegilops tauschii TaxID=37682 RepID=M8BIR5_AEGTA
MFKEALSWQAHSRTPVLSMVVTSYGEIWSGTEGGVIKAWPWDVIAKSLSLTPEEKYMASCLVENAYIDLRNYVTVGTMFSLPTTDVKHMLADHCRAKVWSLTSMTFALWDARTRELLKVFGMDGQVESARLEPLVMPEQFIEEEIKVKPTKKEKNQGSVTFLKKSWNALIGAGGAVRRVATKGTFVEDNRRTETVAQAMDGAIWSGCTDGSIIMWDGNGNWLKEFSYHNSSVQCIKALGGKVWVGYASGTVQVMDVEGNPLGGWTGHSCPVIQMAIGGSYIFTLAHHGGIRGWPLTSPGPLDDILRTELAKRELSYTRVENIKMLVGTWNVAQEKASPESLWSWLGTASSDVGLVVVGLQEVEMGAGVLAMAAAKESVGLEGSANGQWWIDNIGKALDEGISFHRVGSRQLAGLLIAAWARTDLKPHIGDVDAAAVPCGFGRAIGNKVLRRNNFIGGVGLKMRVYDRRICFVNNHFAAHLENVTRRNADFDHIYRTMNFNKSHGSAASDTSVQLHKAVNILTYWQANGNQPDEDRPELAEADMVVFLGDFNYRLYGITYDEARDMVSQRSFDWLRERDQLRAEMKAGNVFQGMREGFIRFPPTYKFQRHQPGLADSDHKPVNCTFSVDLARVNELIRRQEYGKIIESNEKLHCLLQESHHVPDTIISTNNIILENEETVVLRITNNCGSKKSAFEILCEGQSTSKQDGTKTDFIARASFGLPHWLEETKLRELWDLSFTCMLDPSLSIIYLRTTPDVSPFQELKIRRNTTYITLHQIDMEVQPSIGLIEPGETMEVNVHHENYYTQEEFVDGVVQGGWCELTRDKEAVLLVNVTGSTSTETVTHRINVRHCCAASSPPPPVSLLAIAAPPGDAPSSEGLTERSSRKSQSNHLQRSDAHFGASEVHDLHRLRNMNVQWTDESGRIFHVHGMSTYAAGVDGPRIAATGSQLSDRCAEADWGEKAETAMESGARRIKAANGKRTTQRHRTAISMSRWVAAAYR